MLASHGYTADNLPIGSVVAISTLAQCHQVTAIKPYRAALAGADYVEGNELVFGWHEVERYAWEMTDVKQIDPVPGKRQQGLWNWGGEWDTSSI
ncbi:hypothetical protein ABE237_16985 [Brevibacillus formosus]